MKVLTLPPELDFTPRFTTFTDAGRHSHDFFEFVIISDGTVLHTVDSVQTPVMVGDLMLITPGVAHEFDQTGNCLHWDILVSQKLFKKVCDFLSADLFDSITQRGFMQKKIPLDKVSSLNNDLKNFFIYQNDDFKNIFSKSFVAELLCCFTDDYTEYDLQNSGSDVNSFKVKCLYTIHQYFSQPNALNLVRKELGYDNSYFSKKFKEAFNSSPIDFINDLRISYAAFFLKSSDASIESCCYRVGMFSTQFFIKKFKQKYGVTPSQYRKRERTIKFN